MNEPENAQAKLPEQCETMADVRLGVDTLDQQIISMLATRFGYMDAAARIKTKRSAVRDEPRKALVIENARSGAEKAGISGDLIARLWDQLVEHSIAHEFDEWDDIRAAK